MLTFLQADDLVLPWFESQLFSRYGVFLLFLFPPNMLCLVQLQEQLRQLDIP